MRQSRTLAWLRFLTPPRLPPEAQALIRDGVAEGAFPTKRFYILLALSAGIAGLGLLSNSAGVIIGAMLVAPLMGPILGLALGFVVSDTRLERSAITAEVTGLLLAIFVGFLLGSFPYHPGITNEMLARTAPNALDLGIALASGLAAGYASVNPKVNAASTGAAISVALVPPLVTCGLLFAMGFPAHACGAFVLFLANFFCIQASSAFVFFAYGLHLHPNRAETSQRQFLMRLIPSLVAITIMGWFLTGTLIRSVQDQKLAENLKNVLSRQIALRTGGRLDTIIERGPQGRSYRVVAVALTPKVLDASQIRQIEAVLRTEVRPDVDLVMRSLLSQDMSPSGRIYLNPTDEELARQSEQAANFLELARSTMNAELSHYEGASLDSLERVDGETSVGLIAVVRSPKAFTAKAVLSTEVVLGRALGQPVHLVVRNVIDRVFDRSGELYVPEPKEAMVPSAEPLREPLTRALRRAMARNPARSLQELSIRRENSRIYVEALVHATEPVRPSEVRSLEAVMRRSLSTKIRLTVETRLQSKSGSQGWLP